MKKIFLILVSVLLVSGVFTPYVICQELSNNKEYIISPNDILEISVYDEPDLTTTVRVDQNGTIIYPLLGTVGTAGITVRQLENRITSALAADYLVNPQVSIFVKQYAEIFILGQVNKPGSYQMQENLTLTKAIALAGGFTDTADTTNVKIIRLVGDKKTTTEVNADQILARSASDVRMQPRDTIMVEEYGRISVIGQVTRPGVYNLKKGLTVIEAVGLAGGFTPTAAQNGVRVIRNESGKKKIFVIPVSSIVQSGDTSRDILLRAGDTISVPESFF